jgi:hypothetical protein
VFLQFIVGSAHGASVPHRSRPHQHWPAWDRHSAAQRSGVRREAVAPPFLQQRPVGAQGAPITSFSKIFSPVFPPLHPLKSPKNPFFQNGSVRRAERKRKRAMQTQNITPYFLRPVV